MEATCYVEDLLAKLPAVKAGARSAGITKQRFIDRLTWVKAVMRYKIYNWHDRQSYARVEFALQQLLLDDSNGTIRKQPYCILLTGYPGCGKSSYALSVAIACLRKKYGCAHPSDIVTLNETDDFQSEFRSSHKVVIFDDIGAEKGQNVTNPWRKVIDFVNNIRKTSLNPNVEMKGNVYIEPDLVIITTNLNVNLNLNQFLWAPGAIFRRIKKMILLEKGYEYAQVHVPEKADVPELHPHGAYDDYKCMGKPNFKGRIERGKLTDEIVEGFITHLDEQKKFVRRYNGLFDRCPKSDLFSAIYRDLLEPVLPQKAYLPKSEEKKLPFYHRWLRHFLPEGEVMAMAQSEVFVPQMGSELNPLKRMFIRKAIDWDWFLALNCDLNGYTDDERVKVFYKGFVLRDKLHSPMVYFASNSVESCSAEATLGDLRQICFQSLIEEPMITTPPPSIVSETDDSEEITDNDVPMILDLSTKEEFIDAENIDYTFTCQRMERYEASEVLRTKNFHFPDFLNYRRIDMHPFVIFNEQGIISNLDPPTFRKLSLHQPTRKFPWVKENILTGVNNLGKLPDPGMGSWLATMPKRFEIAGYEHRFPNGCTADLILKFQDKYVIVELKGRHPLSGLEQLSKYAKSLVECYKVDPQNIACFFVRPGRADIFFPGNSQPLWGRGMFYQLTRWYIDFVGHCGVAESSTSTSVKSDNRDALSTDSNLDPLDKGFADDRDHYDFWRFNFSLK